LVIFGENAVNIGQNYFNMEDLSEAFFICNEKSFYNEKSGITTTQADQTGTSKRGFQ